MTRQTSAQSFQLTQRVHLGLDSVNCHTAYPLGYGHYISVFTLVLIHEGKMQEDMRNTVSAVILEQNC